MPMRSRMADSLGNTTVLSAGLAAVAPKRRFDAPRRRKARLYVSQDGRRYQRSAAQRDRFELKFVAGHETVLLQILFEFGDPITFRLL